MNLFEGGVFAAGDSPDAVYLHGDLTAGPDSGFAFDLGSVNDSSEIIMPANLLTLNGQSFDDFAFTAEPGFGPGLYTLIDAGGIHGSLSGPFQGTIDGLPGTLSVQGGDVLLNVVPEPSALTLLAVAALRWADASGAARCPSS